MTKERQSNEVKDRQQSTISCDISNERAHLSVCLGANGILMMFYLRKRQIKDLFFHLYVLNIDILA